jgi:excisionase family DNA binding protein
MRPPAREWITVTEAAVLLGYSDTYVRRLVREGRITAENAFGVYLVWKPAVEEFKSGRQPAA